MPVCHTQGLTEYQANKIMNSAPPKLNYSRDRWEWKLREPSCNHLVITHLSAGKAPSRFTQSLVSLVDETLCNMLGIILCLHTLVNDHCVSVSRACDIERRYLLSTQNSTLSGVHGRPITISCLSKLSDLYSFFFSISSIIFSVRRHSSSCSSTSSLKALSRFFSSSQHDCQYLPEICNWELLAPSYFFSASALRYT